MSNPLPQLVPVQIPGPDADRVLQYQQAARYDKFQNTLYGKYQGNLQAAMPELTAIDPQHAQFVQQQAQLALEAAMKADTAKLDWASHAFANVTNAQQYAAVLPMARRFGFDAPDQYDPTFVTNTANAMISAKDRLEAQHRDAQLAFEKLKEQHAETQRQSERDKPIVVAPDATLATRTPEGGYAAAYTAPPKITNFEEAYYKALTTGDAKGAATALQGIQAEATAKRDPNAAALARELSAIRIETARQRLDDMQAANEPLDISPDLQTTRAGRQYVDVSLYTGKERNKAIKAANAAGAIPIGKEQADALSEIDRAKGNQQSILTQVQDLLPKDASGRPAAAVTTTLNKLFQTDAQVAAFNTWNDTAIQTLRAVAGSKGIRFDKAKLDLAIQNLPRLTDTLAVAQQKIANINTMLENAEQSILVRDRSVTPTTTPQSSTTIPVVPPGLKSRGWD